MSTVLGTSNHSAFKSTTEHLISSRHSISSTVYINGHCFTLVQFFWIYNNSKLKTNNSMWTITYGIVIKIKRNLIYETCWLPFA